jgi:glycosyltransferase involved in cell wall biosynthesis
MKTGHPPQITAPLFLNQDVYIFEYVFYYPLLELATALAGKRVIFHYNGITPPEMFPEADPYKEMAGRALSYHYLLGTGAMIIVHSNYIKNYLTTICPALERKIEVMPISVNPIFHRDESAQTSQIKKAVRDGVTLLYVGRLSGNKEVHVLIKAIALIKEKLPEGKILKLILAGAHSRTTTSYYKTMLEDLARSLQVEKNIVFVSDPDINELKNLYLSSDLFVTASIHEGFCIPVAEALSCNIPCVVANTAATPETVGTGGLTFMPSSAEDCCRAVMEALVPETYRVLQSNGKKESTMFTSSYLLKQMSMAIKKVMTATTPEEAEMSETTPLKAEKGETTPLKAEKGETTPLKAEMADSFLELLSSTSNHSIVYRDNIKGPGSRIIKLLRRKLTLPMEVSAIRTFANHQSDFNRSLVEEVRELKNRLKKIPPSR